MKKILQTFVLSILALALFSVIAPAQTKRAGAAKPPAAPTTKLSGVYAGVSLVYQINGMQLYTHAYYFRPDGTFAAELDQPDWKTRVDGTYTIKGKIVTVPKDGDDEPRTIEILSDRELKAGGYNLSKHDFMNSAPAKRLENKSAGSSGGIGTGLTYVGSFSNRVLIFDGKGNFSHDADSTVSVMGETVGGAFHKNNNAGGTYTVKDSVLTLKYADGKVETKSFFYSGGEPGDEVAALINGSFYFEYKPDKDVDAKQTVAETKKETAKENTEENTKEKTEAATADTAPDAPSVLRAARLAHGGAKLDNLKTLRITGKITGANGAINHDVVIVYDFVRRRLRNEFSQNKKLDTVEQLDGAQSFSWIKGRQDRLSAARSAEMKQSFYEGVLGLRADVLPTIETASIKIDKEKNLKTVGVVINGKPYGWLIDRENRLIGEASVENDVQQLDLSDDFRSVSGILLPFSNTTQMGGLILELKVTAIEANPSLTEKDWSAPN